MQFIEPNDLNIENLYVIIVIIVSILSEVDSMNIRIAVPEDAEAVRAIYAPYIRNTAVTFEYDVPSVEEMRRRITSILDKYPYLIAEDEGKVIGYAYANTFHPRAAFSHTAEVSIYIDDSYHGKGLGRMLYYNLEKILKEQNIFIIYACIAQTDNDKDPYLTNASILFHKKIGYSLIGKHNKSGYKFGRWYSVIWMEKVIRERPEFPSDFIPFSKLSK